jgi:Leucine-rich repeat (LRR) protein
MRIRCPKCGNEAAVEAAEAESIVPCSSCGQKLRIPKRPAKSLPPKQPEVEPRLKPAESDAVPWHQSIGKKKARKLTAEGREQEVISRSSSDADRKGRDQTDANGPAESSSRRKGERRVLQDIANSADQGAEPGPSPLSGGPWPRKRKKTKQKKDEFQTQAQIAVAVAGICIVCLLTFVGWRIYKSATTKPTYNPDEVLADLQKAGAFIERDESPEHSVVAVSFASHDFENHILGGLVAFPHLRKLDLSGTKTSDVTLEWIQDVTSLQELNLSHTKVTAGGMQFLSKLVNLEDLNLDETIMTDRALISDHGLHELTGLKKLKRIHLTGTMANGLELKAALPGLEVMKL